MTSQSHAKMNGVIIQGQGSDGQKVMPKPTDAYLHYIHYFRAVAILGIVAVHCRSSFPWAGKIQEQFWSSLLVYSTVLFVFIAGFLFQHIHSRKFNYQNYLSKKASYVILPYLFASIPAIMEKLYLEPDSMSWLPAYLQHRADILKVLYMLLTGKHFGPFWFIPMIALVYLISPLLIYLDKHTWFYQYIFPLMFLLGLFMFNFGFEFSTLESFAFFLPVYMYGMWASRYKQKLLGLGNRLLLPATMLFTVMVVLELLGVITLDTSYGAYRPEETYQVPFNFGKLKMSVLCLVLLNGLYLVRNKQCKSLDFLADYSFGIYFIHLYIIRIVEQMIGKMQYAFYFNTFTFMLHVLLITALSGLIILLIKKVTGAKSRYVIGS